MRLNDGNYFSPEAGQSYMSASQLKRFMECEALAMAEIRGEYEREATTSMLVGSYVDNYFSGTLPQFVASTPELMTQKGTLKAEYRKADEIVAYIQEDDLLMDMIRGEPQKIVTGEICGVPFRGKIDSYLDEKQCYEIVKRYPQMADVLLMAEGAIVDLKIMRDMEAVYKPGRGRLSFIQAWRYDLQLAIYQKLIGKPVPCFIAAVTKETSTDKALIHIPQTMLDAALDEVSDLIPRYQGIKAGAIEPERCEKCDWCKQTKKLTFAIDADDLEGAMW